MPRHPTADAYRIPEMLRDLVLVDMLELTGSTQAAAELLQVSQPTASRRYRRVANDLGLQSDRCLPPGRRYGDAPWLRLLRRGVNHHRLSSGVLRLGGAAELEPQLPLLPPRAVMQWIRLPMRSLPHRQQLLEEELLDGLVLRQDELDSVHCSAASMQLTLTSAGPLWLLCRPDPVVLALARQLLG